MNKIKNKFENWYFKFLEYKFYKKEVKRIMIKLHKNPKEDAYTTILESLWRQIPKEVIRCENDIDEDGSTIIRSLYRCPSCQKSLCYATKFCNSCGQRLDFSHIWR